MTKRQTYPWIAKPLWPLAVPAADLVVDPKNARTHDEANLAAIQASLARFGQRIPLVARRANRQIEAGNARYLAAQRLGWTHVAVVFVDDDPTAASGFALADNRTAELAGWDEAVLAELLATLREDEPDLVAQLLMDQLLAPGEKPGLTDPDDVPEPPDKPVAKRGDLWRLGDHRLLCGDSALPEDVDRLLDGAKIHLVNTDPPYNVKVEPRSNNAIAAGNSSFTHYHHQQLDLARHPKKSKRTTRKMRAKDRPLANDYLSDEEFDRLLAAWFGNLARVLLPGRAFYIWGGCANCANYPPALKAADLYFSQAIIWDKEHPVLTRKDFMGAHEWCFYGWRLGAAHQFFGPNNVPDLWRVKKVTPTKMVHLTDKPVELASRAILYSSQTGEHVLDLFGGSGSTLIGAEMHGRRAFLMELDPAYCDVIVHRWELHTGRRAELVAGRQSELITEHPRRKRR